MNPIKTYYQSSAINNSLLGALQNPYYVKLRREGKIKEDKDAEHFRIGGALDCLLTDPLNFKNEFTIVDFNRPTGKMLKFISSLPPGISNDSPLDDYAEAYKEAAYKTKIERVVETM